jgi:nicotinamidase/pyrazinamidase
MKTVFVNVDTQKDFMDENGTLSIKGANEIRENLKKLTLYARSKNITIVNTADSHKTISAELSSTPDFQNTFPFHCIKYSEGEKFIPEAAPDENKVVVIDWERKNFTHFDEKMIATSPEIVILKDKFDVFTGNPYTHLIFNIIEPTDVIVYGVAAEICVHHALVGLVDKGYKVSVVVDAIKSLPNCNMESLISLWKTLGIKFVYTKDITV